MGFYAKYMKWFWSHGCAMSKAKRKANCPCHTTQ